jgi:hypothetical protein
MELLVVGLTLIFVTLKLLGKLDWPWLWVLAPLWVPLLLTAVAGFTVGMA